MSIFKGKPRARPTVRPDTRTGTTAEPQPYDKVLIARKTTRPTALDLISEIFTDFMELHGDRSFGDDRAVVGGIAMLDGRPVTVIGIQRGRNIDENVLRNFGSAHPEGYRKALRLMKQAEKFGRPVVTLINTSGAFCGVGAEERGMGEAIARNLYEMSLLRVPIVSIIIGEGGSGGAIGLAAADSVWMLSNSVYSIISPEGCASILWKDSSRARDAAAIMCITAHELLDIGVVDRVFEEHPEGAENDLPSLAREIKEALVNEVSELARMDVGALVQRRYDRFRKFGS
ncbi:MAG: acetyl-CoA carboxylase carboxyltransferase subunit alpha [Defluviitaleaceae bacterium]|nr:acetyl-CoA carboxylase carboxyltransferase subunit alpha [Defluviitaleaceae bacterium]